uniref:Uncharacterized protein n=1 Tax=Mucochytrium quahogii TaxID=96639 RepID=A0A7S2WI89_9STRA
MSKIVEERVQGLVVKSPGPDDEYSAVIGTHDGHFHCDEAFACGMLQLTEEFKGLPVVRTRNSEVLDKCNIVVDVGAKFDPAAKRFDHHQREFKDVFFSEDFKTKLSSAGLVYKYYGKEIISNIASATNVSLSDELRDLLHTKVYEGFVEHIDGIDNGIDAYSGEKNYSVSTHLSARVGTLNPTWMEEQSNEKTNAQFKKAVHLTTSEFVQQVERLLVVWLPAREIVKASVEKRFEVDPSGHIVKFEQSCPWKSHLYLLEEEGTAKLKVGDVKYVLYEDSNGAWRIQCVPESENSFQSRLPLPEKYRGFRDQELSDLWGIPGCIFVHAAGFIGGNKTFDGALKMAQSALQ